MNVITLAGIPFGEGLPKICVPLTSGGMPALLSEIQEVRALPADLFEWRADCFYGGFADALEALKDGLWGKPLLCTLRTEREGGSAKLSPEEYERALWDLLDLDGFQLLDVELSCGEDRVRRLGEKAKAKGVGLVVSRHDFSRTPAEDEMVDTLLRMKELGADLPKLAVMPQSPEDVLALLGATLRASKVCGPVITMAMGDLGKFSRVSGALFGSCLTFGAGKSASAPGQIQAEDLKAILEDLSPFSNG